MPDVKFSNLYPYTDFHELNLDWVIKEVKYWSTKVGKTIQSIELTGTVGLVDTYTITYSDGTTSTFDVTNGNGIVSVAKTGTAGLVDTYTITLTDGSTSTFEVTNGTAAIDPTLTLSDYAADAKVTGDALRDIATPEIVSGTEAITKNSPGIELQDGYYIAADGSLTALNAYYTYIYKLDHDGDLYFDTPPTNSAVLMFAVYSGYPSTATFKGTRYRMSDNNLPTSSNKLSASKDDYVAVSCYLSVPASQLYFSLFEDYQEDRGLIFGNVRLNDDQITASNKKQQIYIRYVSGSGADDSIERVEVYQPTENGFIRYDVLHSVNVTKNANVWRLGYAYAVDDDFNNAVALTVYGEWECAIHLNNAGDFSGGIAHGNEIFDNVLFFVDGIVSDITTYTDITQVSELRILTTTDMYDSTDSSRKIAQRGCERIFNPDGLDIRQSLNWTVSDNTTWCYMAMNLPNKNVVEKFYMDTNMKNDTISMGLFSSVKYLRLFKTGAISNEFSIDDYPEGLSGGNSLLTSDNGGNPYVKCYYVVTNGTAVTPSTVWKSFAHYRFDA